MRLCFIGPAESIHTQRWLQAFVDRGHQVHLVTLPGESLSLDRVTVHPLPDGKPKVRFVQWTLALRRILGQVRPHVLHGHYLTRYGWLAAASGFRPLVLTAWGTDAYVDPQHSRPGRWATGWALRRADLTTVDAADLRDRVIALGADPSRVRVIQWGVNTDVFRPDVDTTALRDRLALGAAPVILSTRALTPTYNQDVMVEALPAIRRAAPGAVLVIKYGGCDPDYLAGVRDAVTRLGLGDAVRFVDATPHHELAAYYALADVFVSIASSDSTPVSLLEAMACGATPVVSDLPALREWVTDGENGYLVPPRDPAALAAALVSVLTSDTWRGCARALNRQMIEARADHRREMDRVEQLYASLAHSRRAS